MISRFENKNFFAAHYDWIAAGVGVLALIGGLVLFVMSLGDDPDAAASDAVQNIQRIKPSETGVKAVSMDAFQTALRLTRSPSKVSEITGKQESFLASERRVLCSKCKKAIPGDVRAFPACPFCGEKQAEEVKVVVDQDNDGLPDEWEKKYGLNPTDAADASADSDNDGFTNLEEFVAKTDPTDPHDHPDYLDSLKIVLPLRETSMPIAFTKATPLREGWRCEFVDPARKNDFGQPGRKFSVVVGEKVVDAKDSKNKKDYGFILKKYERKNERHERKGMKGMFVDRDVSEVTLERASDGKVITMMVQAGVAIKNLKLESVDIQATLSYERGTVKNFDVVPGTELNLNGNKYRIVGIKAVNKGAQIVIEHALSGKKRTIEALEQ